jgi:hypothetical protein
MVFGLIVFSLCVFVCVCACVCVIILTPLFIGMFKVSIIITPYVQCVLYTEFCIFYLFGQYMPC